MPGPPRNTYSCRDLMTYPKVIFHCFLNWDTFGILLLIVFSSVSESYDRHAIALPTRNTFMSQRNSTLRSDATLYSGNLIRAAALDMKNLSESQLSNRPSSAHRLSLLVSCDRCVRSVAVRRWESTHDPRSCEYATRRGPVGNPGCAD